MSPKAKDWSFVKLDPTSLFIRQLKEMVFDHRLWFQASMRNEKCHIFECYFIMPDKPVCLVCGRLGTAGYIC